MGILESIIYNIEDVIDWTTDQIESTIDYFDSDDDVEKFEDIKEYDDD